MDDEHLGRLELEEAHRTAHRAARLEETRALGYNDLSADRNTVAVVQALEAILERHVAGQPGSMVEVNGQGGGLVLRAPGASKPLVAYQDRV